MVAVIRVGSSIRRTFHYNENKVGEGVAELIMAGNYPFEASQMDMNQRLNMLLRTAESNPNVRSNSVHISLNFAVGEQLDDHKLKMIAAEYMEAIGFGEQPYLVYRHDDAAHPHIHIATVKVGLDGRRIETQNIGKLRSEPARKAIEMKHGLIRAEDHKKQVFSLKPVNAERVQYGVSGTRRAIGNVLEYVLNSYKYTSLPELNAVLNLYNVSAERGGEGSRIYRNRGLVYRVLNPEGKPVGVPIKASSFHNNPGLNFLERQFVRNDVARQEHKEKLKSLIDFTIKSKRSASLESLAADLRKWGIKVILRSNKEGANYGITYVDFRQKCVFNGSALGKSYSIKGIAERIGQRAKALKPGNEFQPKQSLQDRFHRDTNIHTGHEKYTPDDPAGGGKSLLEQLIQPEFSPDHVPWQWKKKRKKKKKL